MSNVFSDVSVQNISCAVDQCVGTDSDWSKTGREVVMLDKECVVLPRSSITGQDGIAGFAGQILAAERRKEAFVQQKPEV